MGVDLKAHRGVYGFARDEFMIHIGCGWCKGELAGIMSISVKRCCSGSHLVYRSGIFSP